MSEPNDHAFKAALALVFEGIAQLKASCSGRRKFTIDGRLVGDIGEIIAEREFDIVLDEVSRSLHDAKTRDGRNVQIKATFQDQLTFGAEPDLYLGLKLSMDGSYRTIFNGPGRYLSNEYKHRKGFGSKLLNFPIARLAEISATIPDFERVPMRPVQDSVDGSQQC